VFFAIKEELESKKTKYFGHNSDCFYVYDANIGIIFNTTKFSSIKSCFRDFFTKLVRESHKAALIGVEKLAYARLFIFSCHNSICFLPSAKIAVFR